LSVLEGTYLLLW